MTLTVDLGNLVAGAIGGAVVVLAAILIAVAFGHWRIHIGWLSTARAAGIRRAAKLVFFPMIGVVIANGSAWAVQALTRAAVDPAIANAAGLVVGAALGGAHQTLTWTDAQPTPTYVPVPPAPVPLPPSGPLTPDDSGPTIPGG